MTISRFPVEASHTMMFARAIGDLNPVYSDVNSPEAIEAGGVLAPPTFTMAGAQFDPGNHLIPKQGEPWFGSAKEPTGVDRSAGGAGVVRLHAEQHFEYHRPLMAGEVLHTVERDGTSWEKSSSRGGVLKFEEKFIDYVNTASNEVVVTARFVSVQPPAPSAPSASTTAAAAQK
jgi:N-terminal half of MaoC dehydratase